MHHSEGIKLQEKIIQLLEKSPADQFSIYRKLKTVALADLSRAIAELERKKLIHVLGYRKSKRIGANIPIYSTKRQQKKRPDLVKLLPGVTSERVVEYEFLARNLPRDPKAVVLDFGCNWRLLDDALREYGNGKWDVFGFDIRDGACDAIVDLRYAALRSGIADQIICISTLEHIGLSEGIDDETGDRRVVAEMFRILRPRGIAVLTVPYGNVCKAQVRVYDRVGLSSLVKPFSIVKKEFYLYTNGKWKKSSQVSADSYQARVPDYFQSGVCACLVLKK